MLTRRMLAAAMLSFGLFSWGADALAEFPERPVTYIIPFDPGGESDVTARFQEPYFRRLTGQPVVIQYKPGGGGATAWAQLNNFAPDGYTVMNTIIPHSIIQPALKKVGYTAADLDNIYFFHYTPDAIVVAADSPFKTLGDMIAAAAAKPGTVTFSGSGSNTANHLAALAFDRLTGVKTTYIPFKGSAPAMTALLGHQVAASMSYSTQAIQQGTQIRALAVATEARLPSMSDVPTFRELGIDHVGGAYRGISVPKGTPPEIRQRLSDIVGRINAEPEFRQRMIEAGYLPVDVPVGQARAFVDAKTREYEPDLAAMRALGK